MDNRLRKLRNEKKLNLRDAADKLNVTKSTLGNYEKGETSIKHDFLERASEFYNVSVDYLLGRTDIKNYDKLIEKIEKYADKEDIEFLEKVKSNEEIKIKYKQFRDMSEEELAKSLTKYIKISRILKED